MSDQETMDRVFSDMIATGRGGAVVSIPNRAGKSTLHRRINDFMKTAKPIQVWDDSARAQIQSESLVSEEERDLYERSLNQQMQQSLGSHRSPKKNDDFQMIVDEWRDTPQDWREWDCIKRYTRKEIEDMLTPNPIELPKGDG